MIKDKLLEVYYLMRYKLPVSPIFDRDVDGLDRVGNNVRVDPSASEAAYVSSSNLSHLV